MTLSVITGTLSNEFEFRDPWGEFEKLVSQGYFIKQYWTGSRWLPSTKKKVYTWNGKRGQIIQTTGSGKTILAMLLSYDAHSKGAVVAGNLSIRWAINNKNKERRDWKPAITSMKSLMKCYNTHITLDDIRGIIASWKAKEADMVAETANATRKKRDKIDITTQRMKYVPPDMRDIIDEVYVPFIRAYDTTRRAPDGRWAPVELLCLHFSPGFEFLDAKIYNLTTPTARYVLDSFDTLQIAESLEEDTEKEIIKEPKEKRSGYDFEAKVNQDLHRFSGTIRWLSEELPQKEGHETDFIFQNGKLYYIDPVTCYMHGTSAELITKKKNFNQYDYSIKEPIRLLAYEYKDIINYIEYKYLVGHSGNIRLSKDVKKHSHPGEYFFNLLG